MVLLLSDLLSIPAASVFEGAEEEFVRECINVWRAVAEDWVRLGDIHVVHYENVLTKRVDELSRILNFLGLEIDQKRMSCVEFCENDMYKRKAENQSFSPLQFTEVMKKEIVKNILYIDALLQKYGHEGIPFDLYSEFE